MHPLSRGAFGLLLTALLFTLGRTQTNLTSLVLDQSFLGLVEQAKELKNLDQFSGVALIPSDASFITYLGDQELSSLSETQARALLNNHLIPDVTPPLTEEEVYYPRGGCGGSTLIRRVNDTIYAISDTSSPQGATLLATVSSTIDENVARGYQVLLINAVLDPARGSAPSNAYAHLQRQGFDRFLYAADAAGLSRTLQNPEFSGVVFAVGNEAIMQAVTESTTQEELANTVKYHVSYNSYALPTVAGDPPLNIETQYKGWKVRVKVNDEGAQLVDDISKENVAVESVETLWNGRVHIIHVDQLLSYQATSVRDAIVNKMDLIDPEDNDGNDVAITIISSVVANLTDSSTDLSGTLLLPVNEAFTALEPSQFPAYSSLGSATELLGNTDFLTQILNAHIVPGSTDLTDSSTDRSTRFEGADTPSQLSFPLTRSTSGVSFVDVGGSPATVLDELMIGETTILVINTVLAHPMLQRNKYTVLQNVPTEGDPLSGHTALLALTEGEPKLQRELLTLSGSLLAPANSTANMGTLLALANTSEAKEILLKYHMFPRLNTLPEAGVSKATALENTPVLISRNTQGDLTGVTSIAQDGGSPITVQPAGSGSDNIIPVTGVLSPFLNDLGPQAINASVDDIYADISSNIGAFGLDGNTSGLVIIPTNTAFGELDRNRVSVPENPAATDSQKTEFLVDLHMYPDASIVAPEMEMQKGSTPYYLRWTAGEGYWLSDSDGSINLKSEVMHVLYTNTARLVVVDRVMVPPQALGAPGSPATLYQAISQSDIAGAADFIALVDGVPEVAAMLKDPTFVASAVIPSSNVTMSGMGVGSLSEDQKREVLQYHIYPNAPDFFEPSGTVFQPSGNATYDTSYNGWPVILEPIQSGQDSNFTLYTLSGSQEVTDNQTVTWRHPASTSDQSATVAVVMSYAMPRLDGVDSLADMLNRVNDSSAIQTLVGSSVENNYSPVINAVNDADLAVDGTGTVLLPVSLPNGYSDEEILKILRSHVIPGTTSLMDGTQSTSAAGVSVSKVEGRNQFRVVDSNVGDLPERTVNYTSSLKSANGDVAVFFLDVGSLVVPPSVEPTLLDVLNTTSGSVYSQLIAAAQRVPYLVELLQDPGFDAALLAPTDSAFGALLDSLGGDSSLPLEDVPQEVLEAVLNYHVLPDGVGASDSTNLGLKIGDARNYSRNNNGACESSDNYAGTLMNQKVGVEIPTSSNVYRADAVLLPAAPSVQDAIVGASYRGLAPQSELTGAAATYNQVLQAISVLGVNIETASDVTAVVVPADTFSATIDEQSLAGNYPTVQAMLIAAEDGDGGARDSLTELLSRHLVNGSLPTFGGSQSASAVSTRSPSGVSVLPEYDANGRLQSLALAGNFSDGARPNSRVAVQGFAYNADFTKRVIFVDGLLEAAVNQVERSLVKTVTITGENITVASIVDENGSNRASFIQSVETATRASVNNENVDVRVTDLRPAPPAARRALRNEDVRVEYTVVISGDAAAVDDAVTRVNSEEGNAALVQEIARGLGISEDSVRVENVDPTAPPPPAPDASCMATANALLGVAAVMLLALVA